MVTTDLDRSMKGSKRAETLYLGPTLGSTDAQQNILNVTTGGVTAIDRNITLVQVNFAGAVTIQLPSTLNVNPNLGTLVMEGVEIVDIGGFASGNNITILPFPGEFIIGISSIAISVNYGSYTLGPIPTGGWSLLNQNPSSIGTASFETKAAVQAAIIPVLTTGITVLGYTSAGDGGGAIYKKVVAEPAHEGKIQSADGAWWEIAVVELNIRQFGAINSGDVATQIQDAIDCAILLQLPLFLTQGQFFFGTALEVDGSLMMYGVDRFVTLLRPLTDSMNGINVNSNDTVYFHDFQMIPTVTSISGTMIRLTAPSTYQFAPILRDLSFIGCWDCIDFVISVGFTVDCCYFQAYNNNGITVANDLVADAGDSFIQGCIFNGGAGINIYQRSGGGLKILNNKLVGGTYGYRMILTANAITSELWLIGNSIEGQTSACVDFNRLNAVANFGQIQIVGNQFGSNGTLCIDSSDSVGDFPYQVIIDSNNIVTTANGGIGLRLLGAQNVVISNNVLLGAGAADFGISIGANSTNLIVSDNRLMNWSNPIVNASPSAEIHGNSGYNPVGAVGQTPAASPWTYTAGSSPETLMIASTVGISSISFAGNPTIPTAVAANTNHPIELGPNDAVTITYTGVLTAITMIH